MAAVSGKVARIRRTAAAAVNSTNEASDQSTDNFTLSINSTTKQHWDRTSTAPAIFISGSTTTDRAGDIESINYVQGQITWTTSHSTTTTITMDVDYLPTDYLAGGRNWTLNIDNALHDVTAFSSDGTDVTWRIFVPGVNEATVDIEHLIQAGTTDNIFFDALNLPSSNFLLELVVDGGGDVYEMFCRVADFSPSVPLDGVADEGVSLMVDGVVYRTTN